MIFFSNKKDGRNRTAEYTDTSHTRRSFLWSARSDTRNSSSVPDRSPGAHTDDSRSDDATHRVHARPEREQRDG